VGHGVVAERDEVVGPDGEGDVRPVPQAPGAVVLVPRLVDRHLGLVVARQQRGRGEAGDAVAVGVLEPGPQARGVPVGGTAQLALVAAGHRRDHRRDVVGHPVGAVVVEKLDRGRRRQVHHDVGPVPHGPGAVVLVPGAVQRGLVLPGAGGQGEVRLPDTVVRVERQLREGALGLPVTGAAELALEAPGDGHADRRRSRHPRRPGDARRRHGQRQDGCEHDRLASHDTPPSHAMA
jgi:hypothetical protein